MMRSQKKKKKNQKNQKKKKTTTTADPVVVVSDNEVESRQRHGKTTWKSIQPLALEFVQWLHRPRGVESTTHASTSTTNNNKDSSSSSSSLVDTTLLERSQVHALFVQFQDERSSMSTDNNSTNHSHSPHQSQTHHRRQEALVMAVLRSKKYVKTTTTSTGVWCTFANPTTKVFPTLSERQSARQEQETRLFQQQANQQGVSISPVSLVTDTDDQEEHSNKQPDKSNEPDHQHHHPKALIVPVETPSTLQFTVTCTRSDTALHDIRLQGPHAHYVQVLPLTIPDRPSLLHLTFVPPTPHPPPRQSSGVYRIQVYFDFHQTNHNNSNKPFSIVRPILLRATPDVQLYQTLQPNQDYQRNMRPKFQRPIPPERLVPAPALTSSTTTTTAAAAAVSWKYTKLPHCSIPTDVRELLESREVAHTLELPVYDDPSVVSSTAWKEEYTAFWQTLLWCAEWQAHRDIQLFDLHQVELQPIGKYYYRLYVAGLAEGRPSVLRGDLVTCTHAGTVYQGRVYRVELLHVWLQLAPSFRFQPNMDRLEHVRFTITRTPFRTSHVGVQEAPTQLGARILLPQQDHLLRRRTDDRTVPSTWRYATHSLLNPEQEQAVQQIVQGTLRPMPYIVWGPPGTGKTTTVVEAIYQLARLHRSNPPQEQSKLKILLLAPSNDATDILVEKLSVHFPPSEMIRLLAYTRSLEQVPTPVRPYVPDLEHTTSSLQSLLDPYDIVVCTVNYAAKLWCMGDPGLPRGYFDVVCVDEAGHATEPEVLAPLATLLDRDHGQIILAGDPNQLGPIITSEVCQQFGMSVSFMERLIRTSPAYQALKSSTSVSEEKGEQVVVQDDPAAVRQPYATAVAEVHTYPPELVTLLVRNYRSHPSILKLPNELFYRNQLKACGDVFVTHSMAQWEHLPKRNFPMVFHAVDGENLREGSSPSWFNPQEAMTVVDYVELLTKQTKPPVAARDIGIITPYARQVQKIRTALDAKQIGGREDLKVGSVETFQGQERRVILLSTVRSEQGMLGHDLKYNLGFVANPKRFNVAMTRAKALLIVIGNPRVLASDQTNWLPFLRYCREQEAWAGEPWEEDTPEEETVLPNVGTDPEEEWDVVQDEEVLGYIRREE